MTEVVLAAAIAVVVGAALLRQERDPAIGRGGLFLAFVAVAFVAGLEYAGRPKPAWAELRGGDRIVVAAELDPGRAIHVWTRGDPPIAYRFPWDEERAARIKAGLREARERGQPGVILNLRAGYAERVFHPPPVREVKEKE